VREAVGGASQSGYNPAAPPGERRPKTTTEVRTTARTAGHLLCGLALLVGASCRKAATPHGRFILISLDTLRADHLGAYGYRRATSPFLDSLAARGTLFENAIAQLPGTLPSHMSIFTGLYPAEHAVFPPDGVLASQIRTFPEVLHAYGFHTGGHVEGGYVEGRHGFSRGFDEWSDDSPIVQTRRGPEKSRDAVKRTFRRGLEFLKRARGSGSFFLFLHTYSIHDPYDPPEPYRTLYWPAPSPPGAFAPVGTELLAFDEGRRALAPKAVEYFEALYDAQIRYTDDVIKGFFVGLSDLGLSDGVTVIVTSDHGEEFLEHGKLAHTQVYQENVHVPLIVVGAGQRAGHRVASLVQSIDIAPTLYDLAQVPLAARPRYSGRSLAPLLASAPSGPSREAYSEAYLTRDRALYRQTGDSFVKLVRREPRSDQAGAWISGSIVLEATAPRLRFWAASYHEPREVMVAGEGIPVGLHRIGTAGRWIDVALPAGDSIRRVELSSPTCTVPREVGGGSDTRCLSFRIRGLDLSRRELYDVAADHEETRDLSSERPALARELAVRLEAYRWEPVAAPGSFLLDRETEEQLRALGYLP
jgi:arylsulfatase